MKTPEIIFVPGWATDEGVMAPVLDKLGSDCHSSYMPWWECLDTDDNPLHTRLHDNDEAVVLVGWSLGALIALNAAASSPQSVAALVLISSTPKMAAASDYPGADARAIRAMRNGLGANAKAVLSAFAKQCGVSESDPGFARRFTQTGLTIPVQTLSDGLRYLENVDLRTKLPGITQPTLLIHGECDMIVPVESARWAAAALPNATLKTVEGAGHAVLLSHTSSVVQAIKSFFDDRYHT